MLDEYTIDISNINMSTTGTNYYYNTGVGAIGTVTISNSSTDYIIGNLGSTAYSWKNEEFVDCLPDISRVQAMCEQYPGLRIAYEKFVTTYKLVKDDYDNPKD